VRWSGAASGARPRHVRVRVVSRFSARQKLGKNIEMAANASVFRFRIGVVRPCGSCPAPARLLPGSCPAAGSCPAPARLLPGSCPVPAHPAAGSFLPGSCPPGSCPVPARFLPDGRAGTRQEPPRSGGSCAGAGQQPPHHSWVLHRPCADASYRRGRGGVVSSWRLFLHARGEWLRKPRLRLRQPPRTLLLPLPLQHWRLKTVPLNLPLQHRHPKLLP